MVSTLSEVDLAVKYIRWLEDRGYKVVTPRGRSRSKKGGK